MAGACQGMPLRNYSTQQIWYKDVYWGKGVERGPGEGVGRQMDRARAMRAEKRTEGGTGRRERDLADTHTCPTWRW